MPEKNGNHKIVRDEFVKGKAGNRCLFCDCKLNLNSVKMRRQSLQAFQHEIFQGWVCLDCVEPPPDDLMA